MIFSKGDESCTQNLQKSKKGQSGQSGGSYVKYPLWWGIWIFKEATCSMMALTSQDHHACLGISLETTFKSFDSLITPVTTPYQ